jgi:hypothetical protein
MTAWLRQTRTAFLTALVGTAGLALGGLGAGCASDGSGSNDTTRSSTDEVPRTARLVKRDRGRLTYRVPDDGKLWVVEGENDRMIYTGRVRRGDEFELEPGRNRAFLNDRQVVDKDIKSDSGHRIYFESDDRRSGDTEWDLASDRARDRELDRDLERDRDLGDDRISRERDRY